MASTTTVLATAASPRKMVSVGKYNRFVQAERNLHDASALREESLSLKEQRQAQMAALAAAQRAKQQAVRSSTHVASMAVKAQNAQKLLQGVRKRAEGSELRMTASRQRDAWAEHGARLGYRYNVVQAQRVFSSRVEHFAKRRAEAAAAKEQSERRQEEIHAEASAALASKQDKFAGIRTWEKSKPVERSLEWCTDLKRGAAEQVQQQKEV